MQFIFWVPLSRCDNEALTNIEEDCAIESLIDNMVLEDLIVQRTRGTLGDRHGGWWEASSRGGVY